MLLALPLILLLSLQPVSVYICTDSASHSFHKTEQCKSLSKCQATIKKVEIKKLTGRKPCGYCYKSKK